jgi:ornithine cyclodeaminase
MTLLLTRSQLQGLVDPRAHLVDIRAALRDYRGVAPPGRVHAELPHGIAGKAVVLMPGLTAAIPGYSVKVNAKFPQQKPAIKGVILLHAMETGDLVAVVDSALVTAARTALSGALAADILARSDARRVAIVGAGVQGELQLRFLPLIRSIERVRVYDLDADHGRRFAERLSDELGILVDAADSVGTAVADADIVVTATWARQPFLRAGMLRPGAHLTTLGADQPGKCEVDASLLGEAVVIVDDRALALKEGAIAGAGLGPDAIAADLAEVVRGEHPGRTTPREITVFAAVGLPMLDLVLAWGLYREAVSRGIGTRIDFLA